MRLLRSDEQAAVFDVTASGYQIQRVAATAAATACQTLQIPGYVLSEEPGKPQLPVKVVLLGVPADAEIVLEATSLTAPTRGVAGAICPAETPVQSAAEGDELAPAATEVVPDPAVYTADRLFPSAIARVVDLGLARSQRIVRVEISPIQINPVTGALVQHHDIRIALRFNGAAPTVEPVVESAEFEASLKSVLLNYEDARAWRSQPAPAAAAAAWTPPQPGYKVSVKTAGLYQIGRSALAAAGLPVNKLDPRTLRLFNAGQEVAIRVTGESDGLLDEGDLVLFYGQGANTRYTDTNVYWLTYGGPAGMRMIDQPSLAGGTVASTHVATVHVETNANYVSTVPSQPGYDHWYGPKIQAVGATTAQRDFSFVVSGPASGDLSATLETQLASIMDGVHHLRLSVNGQQVQDTNWSDRALFKTSVTFPQTLLHEGNNTVRVALINDTPGRPTDIVYTDWLNIGYQRTYAVTGDRLPFGGDAAGAWEYRLTGFTSADVEAYNVTDPLHPARITGAAVTPAAGSHNLAFGDNSAAARQYSGPHIRTAPGAIEDRSRHPIEPANGRGRRLSHHLPSRLPPGDAAVGGPSGGPREARAPGGCAGRLR